jgi:hypothetical protein
VAGLELKHHAIMVIGEGIGILYHGPIRYFHELWSTPNHEPFAFSEQHSFSA